MNDISPQKLYQAKEETWKYIFKGSHYFSSYWKDGKLINFNSSVTLSHTPSKIVTWCCVSSTYPWGWQRAVQVAWNYSPQHFVHFHSEEKHAPIYRFTANMPHRICSPASEQKEDTFLVAINCSVEAGWLFPFYIPLQKVFMAFDHPLIPNGLQHMREKVSSPSSFTHVSWQGALAVGRLEAEMVSRRRGSCHALLCWCSSC